MIGLNSLTQSQLNQSNNKIHDTFLTYEFNKWRKQKEVNNDK